VEDDVVTQEAALIERMNEVRLSGARQREQITRLRTLRTLAVCALGAGLLMCSAFGIAVAGFLERRAREDRADPRIHSVAVPTPRASGEGPSGAAPAPAADRASRLVRLTVGGVSLRLTPDQYVLYRRITSGPIDQGRLQAFLLQLLPAQEVAAFERALLASREDPFAEVAASHRGALLAVERHLRRAREGAAQRPAEDVEAAEGEEDEGSTAASEPQEQGEPPQSDEDALDPIEDGEEPPDDQGDAPPPAPEQGGPDSPSPPPESPSPDPGGPESSSPLPGAPDSPEGAPSLGD
ncbi:MAG: hypothetical protein ACRDJ5_04330, partial [Actinomycetota bacterium]